MNCGFTDRSTEGRDAANTVSLCCRPVESQRHSNRDQQASYRSSRVGRHLVRRRIEPRLQHQHARVTSVAETAHSGSPVRSSGTSAGSMWGHHCVHRSWPTSRSRREFRCKCFPSKSHRSCRAVGFGSGLPQPLRRRAAGQRRIAPIACSACSLCHRVRGTSGHPGMGITRSEARS